MRYINPPVGRDDYAVINVTIPAERRIATMSILPRRYEGVCMFSLARTRKVPPYHCDGSGEEGGVGGVSHERPLSLLANESSPAGWRWRRRKIYSEMYKPREMVVVAPAQ